MKFKLIKVIFDSESIEIAEELISHIFFSNNIRGVQSNIPLIEPNEGFGSNIKRVPDQNYICGYVPLTDSCDLIVDRISNQALQLEKKNINIQIETSIVNEKSWENSWKEFFHVLKITDKIIIKPEWREYIPSDNEIVIEIDPGMAFGTGTHPSTSMCLKLMEKYVIPETSFLDVGTGSGILMIAAAKLGAKKLVGIDNDEAACIIARENLTKNLIDNDKFTIQCRVIEKLPEHLYDFIAVNIIAQVIIKILAHVKSRLKPGGIAILAGIIQEREKDVLKSLEDNGLKVIQSEKQEEWVGLAIRNK